ncbi:hypothetical protein [Streptomyces yaizuensis]|uniref:Uncharacterized protein n=1 Tax=Streptomyces yaizuensis TaxID=2989713 RepID=A0ABQ5P6H1_9ACTN|nr:hypothetical protein [Streptomyces sp. YSPA8]GLF98191.1 hypothetical protein SYYSPA8_27860 [Streptomyces sp. YSPA8]
MALQPPQYEWTAETGQEAETSLEGVRNLIDAHLKTLLPGDAYIRGETRRSTRVKLRVSLDLGPVIEAINGSRQLREQCGLGVAPADS